MQNKLLGRYGISGYVKDNSDNITILDSIDCEYEFCTTDSGNEISFSVEFETKILDENDRTIFRKDFLLLYVKIMLMDPTTIAVEYYIENA